MADLLLGAAFICAVIGAFLWFAGPPAPHRDPSIPRVFIGVAVLLFVVGLLLRVT